MRVIKLLVISLLLLAPKLWAQGQARIFPNLILSLDSSSREIDFGTVAAGSEIDTALTIENVNCDTIWLSGIHTLTPFHCDTALTGWRKWPWIPTTVPIKGSRSAVWIAPGDSARLLLSFRPPSAGNFSENLTVDSVRLFSFTFGSDTSGFAIHLRGTAIAPASVLTVPNSNFLELSAYPNPDAGAFINISYDLPSFGQAEIALYTIIGTRVATLINGYQPSGNHRLKCAERDLAAGDYICVLRTTSADGTLHSASCKLTIQK